VRTGAWRRDFFDACHSSVPPTRIRAALRCVEKKSLEGSDVISGKMPLRAQV
jgi:hypothetical protein